MSSLALRSSLRPRLATWLGRLAPWARIWGRPWPVRAAAAPEMLRGVRPFPVPLRPPRSVAERSALALLHREGAMPFGTLVQRVARDLYVHELRHSGWAVEIGVFGPVLFLPDAAREIEAADGALWQIDRSAGPRPAETPPTHT